MCKSLAMRIEANEKHHVGVLWPPITHRWNEILKDVSKDGVSVRRAFRYTPICENDFVWNKFIIDCYLSHEVIDNPGVNLNSKTQKLMKKIEYEHLNRFDRSLCVFTFEVTDSKKIINVIRKELMKDWQYTEQRIEENRTGLISKGHPYEMNIIKDIIRKRFHDDSELLPYIKGAYAGRKRIMHTPVSQEGCTALLNFLEKYPHEAESIEI